jgi:exosortase
MSPALETPAKASFPYTQALLFGALILLCYAPTLAAMVDVWATDSDMGHGFFVPVIAGYIVWQQKDHLRLTPVRPNAWGLVLVLWGAVQYLVATLGIELFLSRTAVILTLAGAVWAIAGTAWLKKVAFPLLLLCFMVPIPAVIFNSITFPLQMLATRLADLALNLLNVPVLREGNILELPSGKLEVVEACSGIRSLLSLTFLSLVYGYFFEQKRWVRGVLFFMTVPIAILANSGRVTLTGLLSEVNPSLAEGFFHESTGWVIFMLALAILILFHRGLVRATKTAPAKA